MSEKSIREMMILAEGKFPNKFITNSANQRTVGMATKEFGSMLPDGVQFALRKHGAFKSLVLKYNGEILVYFNGPAGVKSSQQKELTKDLMKRAVASSKTQIKELNNEK